MTNRPIHSASAALALLAATLNTAPAHADVRDGVEAWSRGDYATAIAEWQGPAAAGDADAMFNLAQAYRLGRGVPSDLVRAEQLLRDAAAAGHLQAADTYGLLLFQDGRRETALPYVQSAAARGDPRAQYLLGVAHFNGDLVERDWVRAYALLSLANGSGLAQAGSALAQMDGAVPLEQRQRGVELARQLEAEAAQARAVQLAAADLGQGRISSADPAPQAAASSSGAREALAQARAATGTENPAAAGASFARPVAPPVAPPPAAVQPPPVAQQRAAVAPPPVVQQPPAAAAPSRTAGPWRVQLGAFGVEGNAERLWQRLSSRPELAGRERMLVPTGRVTRLLAGGYASQAEAQSACDSLRRAGQDCLVTRN